MSLQLSEPIPTIPGQPEHPIKPEETPQCEIPVSVAEVVIIGGGPAGLVAALSAKRQGATSVVILEARGRGRCRVNMLLLDAGIVADIQRLGADVSSFAAATDFTFIDAQIKQLYQFPLGHTAGGYRERSGVFDMVPRRTPHSDVSINELEQVLIDVINDTPGIQLIFNARVNGIEHEADATVVEYSQQGKTYSVKGDFIGISDGARSKTLNMLGGKRVGQRDLELAVLANFQQPGLGQVKLENDNRTEEILALRGSTGSTVSITLPVGSEWEACDTSDETQRDKLAGFVRQQAKKVGIEGPIVHGPLIVQVQLGRANRSVFNHNIFVLGDALRSSTPRLGLGANWAMRDAIRFGVVVRMCHSNKRWLRALARPWFRLNTWIATHLLNFQCLMLGFKRPEFDPQQEPPSPAGRFSRSFKIFRKQLLFRYNWRSGKAIIASYEEESAHHSIQSARQSMLHTKVHELATGDSTSVK